LLTPAATDHGPINTYRPCELRIVARRSVANRAEVDEGQIYLLSTDPPSIVAILADFDTWVTVGNCALFGIGAQAADMFAEGALNEAGADAWRATAPLRQRVTDRVRAWARALAGMRNGGSPRTSLDFRIDDWSLGRACCSAAATTTNSHSRSPRSCTTYSRCAN